MHEWRNRDSSSGHLFFEEFVEIRRTKWYADNLYPIMVFVNKIEDGIIKNRSYIKFLRKHSVNIINRISATAFNRVHTLL